jgi:hypothetical protein
MAVIYCVVVESPKQIIGTNKDKNEHEQAGLRSAPDFTEELRSGSGSASRFFFNQLPLPTPF